MAQLQMFIQEFLPRFLIFLGSHISFAIIDLGGVFEADVVEHVSRDMVGSVGKPSQEPISISKFCFCVFSLECLLECKVFNVALNGGHDRAQEEVTCQCRGPCLESGWFDSSNFFGVGGGVVCGAMGA